jgi:hypothetical protein
VTGTPGPAENGRRNVAGRLAAAALWYAARGWPVFPCRPGRKDPATAHGFHDATTDPAVIEAWWARMPTANVGVATGAPGPDVLDVDVKADTDGFAAFDRARRAGLLAGAVARVRTRNGGLHLYFTGTDQPCGRLPRHCLDFKAAGGYVLAPPSVVAAEAWAANAPGSYDLLELRAGRAGRLDWPAMARLLDPPKPAPPRLAGAGGRGVSGLAGWVARQEKGNRNDALYWAACRAVEQDRTDVLDELVTAAVTAGLDEAAARRTVDSARRRLAG